MEYGYLLVIASVIAGGVVGALVRSWSIMSRLYSLEDRVGVLEGVTTREVKIRAAQSRGQKTSVDDQTLKDLQALGGQHVGMKKKNWWERLPVKG